MNLLELEPGTDYAYYFAKGRNDHYRHNARRVKVIRRFKEYANSENTKMTGYADVMMLEDDGTPKTDSNDAHITRKIRARDIAMRWDAYEEERAHREAKEAKERKEREERQRQREENLRLERERLEQEARERREREEAERLKFLELLRLRFGITDRYISSIDKTYVILRRSELEEALGIGQQR